MLLQNRDRTSPRNSLNHERSGKRSFTGDKLIQIWSMRPET